MTLVETALAAAILALAAGAALYAVARFAKYSAQQAPAQRTAAIAIAEQTLRVAQDAWKYGPPGNAPAGTQRIPLPGTLTTTLSSGEASAHITVTVQYTPDPSRNDTGIVSVSGDVVEKAPLPGSQIDRPGLITGPGGAP